MIIAIDGPAASGKSTIAKKLAKRLKMDYIDTGAMYRACFLKAQKMGIDISRDYKLLQAIIEGIVIRFEDKGKTIFLDGVNVTKEIRDEVISLGSSKIAKIDFVRSAMVRLQREMGKRGSVVLDGRDIGTKVFPEADFKFFIVASIEERARRRLLESTKKKKNLTLLEIEKNILKRDRDDTTRKISPLVKATDAIEIDTTKLKKDEVLEKIIKRMKI